MITTKQLATIKIDSIDLDNTSTFIDNKDLKGNTVTTCDDANTIAGSGTCSLLLDNTRQQYGFTFFYHAPHEQDESSPTLDFNFNDDVDDAIQHITLNMVEMFIKSYLKIHDYTNRTVKSKREAVNSG